ncbi:MAG: DinB family protein [Bryobacterales bacterium]|nr:DinB family protein [Bryobacterales bacterium]
MDRRKALRNIGIAAAGAGAAHAQEWKDGFARQWRDMFLSHWRVEKEYTLAVVDAMPADGFDSKPVPAQRTFGEQLVHLGRANVAYMTSFGVKEPPVAPTTTDKATVRAWIAATFDYVDAVLSQLTEKDLLRTDLKFSSRAKPHNGSDLFMRAYTHTAHHRGQVIVYLRVKGIVPPTWAFEPSARA